MTLPVPAGTRGPDCDVDISCTHLRAGLRGQPPALEGELAGLVRPGESSWSLVDGAALEVTLQKANDGQGWPALLRPAAGGA